MATPVTCADERHRLETALANMSESLRTTEATLLMRISALIAERDIARGDAEVARAQLRQLEAELDAGAEPPDAAKRTPFVAASPPKVVCECAPDVEES